MKFRSTMALGLALSMSVQPVFASTTIVEAVNQIRADSTLISGWTADQLKYAVPFNGTSGDAIPSQLKLFGVEVGVEGVASSTKIDTSAFRQLPTSLVDTTKIDTFSRLPMPSVLGHAQIGLPFGIFGGIRVGGIPKQNFDNGSTHVSVKNKIVGIDVRKTLIQDGLAKFGLTVGANYTHIDGSFDISSPFTGTNTDGGTTTTLDGTGTGHSDWTMNSYGLQAILNKKVAFINPYVGASVNRNAGTVNSSIRTTGTVTQGAFPPQDIDTVAGGPVIGSASSKANKWDLRGLLGIEFSILPFVRLGLGGEYAGTKNVAGSLGLRVQFGGI